MTEWQHLLLLPGLLCDDRLWQPQVDAPSEIAEIVIADMTRDDTLAGMPACRHAGTGARCDAGAFRARRVVDGGLCRV